MERAASIAVNPRCTLLDERVKISVSNLSSPVVTLHLNLTNGLNLSYDSFNSFAVSEAGTVDLEKDKPLMRESDSDHKRPSSYSDIVDSMGLFRSLTRRQGFAQRCWSADVTKPYQCTLSVLGGEVTSLEDVTSSNLLASETFERRHLPPGATREVANENVTKHMSLF